MNIIIISYKSKWKINISTGPWTLFSVRNVHLYHASLYVYLQIDITIYLWNEHRMKLQWFDQQKGLKKIAKISLEAQNIEGPIKDTVIYIRMYEEWKGKKKHHAKFSHIWLFPYDYFPRQKYIFRSPINIIFKNESDSIAIINFVMNENKTHTPHYL